MASLQELLAEEGFRGGKTSLRSSGTFFGLKAVSMPLYLYHEQSPVASAPNVGIRTERTRSDVSKHGSRIELQKNERARVRRSRTDLHEIERLVVESKKSMRDIKIDEERECDDLRDDDILSVRSSGNFRYKVRNNTEFLPNTKLDDRSWKHVHENESFSDGSLNESQEHDRVKDKFINDLQETESYEERTRKDLLRDERHGNRSTKHLMVKMSSSKNSRNRSSQNNKKSGELQSQRQLKLEQMVSEPALDEVAIQAMISILSGYIRRFLKDKNFRSSLRHNCMSCLNFTKTREGANSAVAVNLKQAIEGVERVAEELGSPKELKKVSLQLSVIAGLNSKDLKDGFTSGISNSHLAACAHLYLSLIYKLQKKDRASAKHLLQVFCDSPFQARMTLLPDLWDHLFLPHLSHLRVWYDQEAEAITKSSSKPRKIKLLEKVYNEILDSGTYQFAVYYKEWLTAGTEAPPLPSIHIPKTSVFGVSRGGSHGPSPEPESSPVRSISSQPMISKRLYEAVFGRSNTLNGTDEFKDGKGEENFSTGMRSFDGSIEENDNVRTYSPKPETYTGQHMVEDPRKKSPKAASLHEDGLLLTPDNEWGLHQVAAELTELEEEADLTKLSQNNSGSTMMLHLPSHTKANELTLKKLAKAIFQQQNRDSPDSVDPDSLLQSKCMPVFDLYNDQSSIQSCTKCNFTKAGLASTTLNVDLPTTNSSAGPCRSSEHFERSSYFSSIPKDFICPLTGQLFEDPVTIETGQTFERVALKEWLDRGNRTCPVTGKTLGSRAIPITNFVLKRIVDGWKSEHCRNLLVFANQIAGCSIKHVDRSKDEAALFILEQLLIGFNSEEAMENAKHLISLGGLQFLVQRFEFGDLDEKTRVTALLSCCIKADGGCRNYLARNIKESCLIELLHSKQVRSRKNAVLLLTELICLNRRTIVTSFLNGLQKEGIMNTLHVLLVYLQSSSFEQKPLVSVLLLHFDLLVEPQKYSIYREEAVDAIIAALNCSLVDEEVKEQCCRALLILGGHFSHSGEVLTETWLLKQAGFFDIQDANSLDDDEDIQIDEAISWEEEEKASEDWLRNLAALLLGNGKKSFLESISKCISSENPDLVRACLTTVAWLSRSLASMLDAEFQLSAFSSLIHPLKQQLENERVEHRVLASLSLLNFSEISGFACM
ncbi:putative E3 ubiquitin-protein ligase LIN isoform X2 [Magnolia sinica]|uniref:putative E3 ubiquitin-protein ligase LIN isoform X2 n=1 Tax=Magnolia sinica TaxID=86752 RepID=UPI002659847A|nr:putative E3 ubiquitin-protein ligase LIN isoform X2 [Magnolia sinica]